MFGKQNNPFKDAYLQNLAAESLLALGNRPIRRRGRWRGRHLRSCGHGRRVRFESSLNSADARRLVNDVRGVQLNPMHGSGQQAFNFATGQLREGMCDVRIAGVLEHVTQVSIGDDARRFRRSQ